MKGGAAFRGQPLLLLGVLLGAWIAGRAALWQAPFSALVPAPLDVAGPRSIAAMFGSPAAESRLRAAITEHATLAALPRALPAPWQVVAPSPAYSPPLALPDVAVGHSLMLLAGLAQMQVPPPVLALIESDAAPGVPRAPPAIAGPASGPDRASRWSADGWLLWRQDGGGPLAAAQPGYGRSQAGAVVRYRLSEADGRRPQLYLRASSALAGPDEQEVAAGLSARPLARVPLRVAAEARATRTAGGTEVRPAVYAVTELPPAVLPLAVRGEAYLQAGYVGGRFATAFIDGQARAERRIAGAGDNELRAGAGIWGGAQKGAARLDVGPTATVSFRLGEARGRASADYRFRVAGDAQPASGPALTLSAGF